MWAVCITAACIFITACEETQETPIDNVTVNVDIEDDIVFGSEPDTKNFRLTSDGEWHIESSSCDWLTITPESGDAGEEQVIFVKADKHTDTETRSCEFTVYAGKEKATTIGVRQTDVSLSIDKKDTLVLDDLEAGSSLTFNITASAEWTLTFDNKEWLNPIPRKGVQGKTKITVKASANLSEAPRIGTITFISGETTKIIYVQQKKAKRFTLADKAVELTDKAKYPYSFKISASQAWSLQSADSWLKVEPASGSAGTYMLNFSADVNTGSARNSTVTVTMGADSQTVAVTQGGKDEYYEDETYIKYHSHTKGEGAHIVIIGDGFPGSELHKEHGYWLKEANGLAEIFLHMPVVRDLTDYFDIYIVMSEAKGRGTANGIGTKYGLGLPNDFGFLDKMKAAVKRIIPEIKDSRRIIAVGRGMVGGYAMGDVAIYSTDEGGFDYWMIHEFAGHVVGQMPDTYCGGSNSNMKTAAADGIKKGIDDYRNSIPSKRAWMIDYSRAMVSADNKYVPNAIDSAAVIWAPFMQQPQYAGVVTLSPEGHYYGTCGDLLTPEPHGLSTMTSGGAYFMTPERYQLWKEIMIMAEETDLSLASFYEFDNAYIDFYFETDESGKVLFNTNGTPKGRNRGLDIFSEWEPDWK
jgi:hypothetical protein